MQRIIKTKPVKLYTVKNVTMKTKVSKSISLLKITFSIAGVFPDLLTSYYSHPLCSDC